jgi:hypothetical protein
MTLVANQYFTVSWGTRNKKWYESLGFEFTGKSTTFVVEASLLTPGVQQRVKYICDNCKNVFDNAYSQLLINRKVNETSKDYCMSCAHSLKSDQKRHSYEFVKKTFESNGCKLIDTKYKNNETKLRYVCSCGNESKIRFSDFQNGGRCKSCVMDRKKTRLLTFEYVSTYFEDNGCKLLTTTYTGNTQKLKYICICGNMSETIFNSFSNGTRCKSCGRASTANARRLNIEKVKEIFERENCILLSQHYQNTNTPVEFRCSCGNTDYITVSIFKVGVRCRKCVQKNTERKGEKNPNWNPLKTDEERLIERNFPEYREWAKLIKARDKYICQCCGIYGGRLIAHHLDGYGWCKEKRTDINNGITMCRECHTEFHSVHGSKNNTVNQWVEFLYDFLDAYAI